MNSAPIPFYRPSLPPLQDYTKLLEEIWESRMLSNFSKFAQELEKLASEYLAVPHVRAVVSGDIGLIIALKALDLPDGAPCFISDFTFNSTINAALWAGLKPVIVDIDRETFNLAPEALAGAMRKHNKRGVILATHVFGNPAEVDSLQTLAREQDNYLVFDSAHALGSRVKEKAVGGFGDAEIFSLSGTKIVTSAEGGLIATPHKWLADKISYLRAYGFQNDYNSRYVGINGKISELHCAMAILSLKQIEQAIGRRQQIVTLYQSRLKNHVGWQKVRPGDRSTYKDVSIVLGNSRQAVEKVLHGDHVQTKRYFLPLHYMKPYQQFSEGRYPVTEEVYQSTLCIPAYADLSVNDVDRISARIIEGLETP